MLSWHRPSRRLLRPPRLQLLLRPHAAPIDGPSGKVENIIVTSSAEASPAVTRLLQMATEQAERLVGESAGRG